VALALAVVSGCGADNRVPNLGTSRASIVEGLPVPRDARLYGLFTAGTSAEYRVPSDVSMNVLNRWYETHLVPGRSWRNWTSCVSRHLQTNPGGGRVWIWQRKGTELKQLYIATIVLNGRLTIHLAVTPPLPNNYSCA
jgi:hypothetical protein